MRNELKVLALVVAAGCTAAVVTATPAAEPVREQSEAQVRERIYGSQLMTEQERNEYRARMRTLRTAQEREQFRKEHHERMKERAAERGLSLPDDPPAQGRGAGPRHGNLPGAGAGPRGDAPGGGARGR